MGDVPKLEFTFGEVEAALAKMNNIASAKRVAFAGRLRILQKNGIPMRDTPGRGRAGTFSLDHVFQLAFAVELLQCGISPQRAGEIIKRDWWAKRDQVLAVLWKLEDLGRQQLDQLVEALGNPGMPYKVETSWVWAINLHELADLSEPREQPFGDRIESLSFEHLQSFTEQWSMSQHNLARIVIINLPQLIGTTCHSLGIHIIRPELVLFVEEYEGLEPFLADAARTFSNRMEGLEGGASEEGFDPEAWFRNVLQNTDWNAPAVDLRPTMRMLALKLPFEVHDALARAALVWRRNHLLKVLHSGAKRNRDLLELVPYGVLELADPENSAAGSKSLIATEKGREVISAFAEVWELR